MNRFEKALTLTINTFCLHCELIPYHTKLYATKKADRAIDTCKNQIIRFIVSAVAVIALVFGLQAQDLNSSFGWANYDGQILSEAVTGGGNTAAVKVKTFAELKSAVESSDAKVIHVMNDMGSGYKGKSGDVLKFKSNKTVIGAKAGITVKCSFQISNVSNLIIRNLIIRGPGNSNSEQNWDAVNIQGSKRIWFDHCTVMEGEDGNFDVVKGSDNVTASWCKFTYVTNSEHNFSNLIGSSDNESISHGKLNVTYAYCWWDNVNSRCPRTRYGKIHVLNCYYSNVGSGAYAGFMSNIRVEGCYFENSVNNPTGLISTGGQAGVFTIDCNVNGTKTDGYNEPFTPPYEYTKYESSEVKSMITDSKNGAGATLENPFSTVSYTLSVSVAQGQGTVEPSSGSFENGTDVTITATGSSGYFFDHWEGDLSGNTNPITVNMTSDKNITAYFVQDTRTYYTITGQATPGGSITQNPQGSQLVEGTMVTFSAVPNDGWTFSEWSGDYTGKDSSFTVSPLISDITVNAAFMPVDLFTYEAEYAMLNKSVKETKNAGFSGEAYVNFDNETGSSAEIPVYVNDAGERDVSLTFSNGSGSGRVMSISVNGTEQVSSIEFEATTDWTTWLSKDITLTFSLGYNTITLISTDDQGGPNIDKIVLAQGTNTLVHTSNEPDKNLHLNYTGKILCIQAAASNMVKICIFSLNGKIVFSKNFNNISGTGKIELPLNRFRKGIYLIRAECDGFVKTGHMNLL
ncbi:MAG: hypothetical protein GXY77_07725 [Fibrobacter sp.]|nr:hypothetical protein [Fibrobacter sp.]